MIQRKKNCLNYKETDGGVEAAERENVARREGVRVL